MFYEVSALENHKIKECFTKLIEDAFNRILAEEEENERLALNRI